MKTGDWIIYNVRQYGLIGGDMSPKTIEGEKNTEEYAGKYIPAFLVK